MERESLRQVTLDLVVHSTYSLQTNPSMQKLLSLEETFPCGLRSIKIKHDTIDLSS